MFHAQLLAVLTFGLLPGFILAFTPCPLLGPSYPPPKLQLDPSGVSSALKGLTEQFDELVRTGNSTHGPFASNTTSFSVALFAAEDYGFPGKPFFYDYHYTAPALKTSLSGTHSINADSIYRIGSLTEVFTVWATLIEAGDRIWNDPVTEFVPELAEADKETRGKHDPIAYVRWEEVTVGQLASHMSGIARDCK